MATYFHGNPTELQAPPDGLQTLVLMNPAAATYVHQHHQHHQHQHQQQFSDTNPPTPQPHNNLIFLNSASLSPHAPPPPPHSQHFVGIPTSTTATTTTATPQDDTISPLHGFLPRIHHYNLYNPNFPSPSARDTPRAKQGLSLSLSPHQQQQPPPGFGFQNGQGQAVSGEDMRVSGGSASSGSGVTNGVSGMQSVLLSSKYLKAAQELLDEVVNVNSNNGNNNKNEFSKKVSNGNNNGNSNKVVGESSGDGGDQAAGKRPELSTAERQEIQMKKAKLINMLEEVEQRYRQYHHQMQIVVSSFEQAAGIGSAKTYTSLALKTISKQFRCLKDAIAGQIKAANKLLGEEDSLGGRIEGSRLKFVDHHLRQQRALQQLGMIQHNAWRPQRGLPERSVSVLRAWLFEHFLHPYPKDSDKQMLAKQTGLTRSQVSNWFINARVRLWKPMVEEMYMEEIKEQEQNNKNGSEDKTNNTDQNNEDPAPNTAAPQEKKAPIIETQNKAFNKSNQDNATNQNNGNTNAHSSLLSSMSQNIGANVHQNPPGFSLIRPSELESFAQASPKKPRTSEMMQSPGEADNEQVPMKFGDDRENSRDGYSFMGNQMNFIQGFGHQYPIGEMGRFDTEQFTPRFSAGNNGVSLTLGLPHCENLSLSAATHQPFIPNQNIQLGRRVDIGETDDQFGAINSTTPHSSAAAYENINIQNRKTFAAQLLHDFVA